MRHQVYPDNHQQIWPHTDYLLSERVKRLRTRHSIFSARLQNVWRTLRVSLGFQRLAHFRQHRDHGYKWQLVQLTIVIIGCVFVCEMRKNANGVQNMSGLNKYTLCGSFKDAYILPTGLFSCLFCIGIFAVHATIVPGHVNPTPEQELIDLRPNNLRQQDQHACKAKGIV